MAEKKAVKDDTKKDPEPAKEQASAAPSKAEDKPAKKESKKDPAEGTAQDGISYQGYSLVQVPEPTDNAFMSNANRRSDDDALHGHAVRVVAGEHEGRYGVLQYTATMGKDGYPKDVVIHTFDPDALTLTVPYKDIRPDLPGRW